MFPQWYKLVGKMPVKCTSMDEAMRALDGDRYVAQTTIRNIDPWLSKDIQKHKESAEFMARERGKEPANIVDIRMAAQNILISTVFLGLDHNFDPNGPPILFETIVFNGPLDEWQKRYVSYDFAEHGHKQAVALVERALAGENFAEGGK
jgi:hypothetical protein